MCNIVILMKLFHVFTASMKMINMNAKHNFRVHLPSHNHAIMHAAEFGCKTATWFKKSVVLNMPSRRHVILEGSARQIDYVEGLSKRYGTGQTMARMPTFHNTAR